MPRGAMTTPRACPTCRHRPSRWRRRSRSGARSCTSPSPSPPRRPRRPPEMPEHRCQTPERVEIEIKVPAGAIDIETVDGDESLITLEGDERLIEMTEVRHEG